MAKDPYAIPTADDMLKKANDSFRKESERKKLTAEGPKLGQKKKTAKKTVKATARKKG